MDFRKVAEPNALEDGDRLHLQLEGRYVSVIRDGEEYHCLDSVCFHAGGPLGLGDIEELEGQRCIVCPWHYSKVSLQTGEKFYQGLEKGEGSKMVPGEWKSVGARQRVHKVELREDGIYVALQLEGELASDEYAQKQECGERVRKAISGSRLGVPGYKFPGDGLLHPSGAELANVAPPGSPHTPHTPLGIEGEDKWPVDPYEALRGQSPMRNSRSFAFKPDDSFKEDSMQESQEDGQEQETSD